VGRSAFEAGVDKVDLSAIAGIADFDDLLAAAVQSSGTTILNLVAGNQLVLYEIPIATLSANDFIFAP
jgi:hypothetical protein